MGPRFTFETSQGVVEMKGYDMKRATQKQTATEHAKMILTMGAIAAGLTLTSVAPALSSGHGDGQRPAIEFEAIDADGNGEITSEEFATFHAARKAERFSSADTNSDGLLSAEELSEAAGKRASRRTTRMIERFDENNDGLLSMDEMPERGEGRRGKRGGDHESMMDRFDEDNNGTISVAEFEAAKEHMQSRRGRHGHHGDN